MKRFFLFTIAIAVAAVGCTKSGLVDAPQTYEAPISFEPYAGKIPVTKASLADGISIRQSLENGGGFHVTGFINNSTIDYKKYYMNKDVYDINGGSGATASWKYEGVAYWPEGSTLDFVAYGLNAKKEVGGIPAVEADPDKEIEASPAVPGTPTITFDDSNFPYTKFTYSVPNNVADQEDLVVSKYEAGKSLASGTNSGTVQFVLEHVLSRVGFSVKTNNAPETDGTEGVKVTIKNITLNGSMATSGVVDLTQSTAFITAGTASATSYSIFDSEYVKGGELTHPGFITGNTLTAVPIYANTTFTGTNNAVQEVPSSTNGVPVDEDLLEAYNNRFMMIMPGTVGNLANNVKPYIEVIYQLTDAEEQVARITLEKTATTTNDNGETVTTTSPWTFEAGKAYEFVFTASTTAIGFSVTVSEWVTTGNPLVTQEFTLTPNVE